MPAPQAILDKIDQFHNDPRRLALFGSAAPWRERLLAWQCLALSSAAPEGATHCGKGDAPGGRRSEE